MLDVGMDFHCMKRKQLQALCKKHKIPANSSNLEMANKLTDCLKEKENSVMMEKEENASEGESNSLHVDRKVKKVRFIPENELIEFTRSKGLKRGSRRNSICRRESNCSIEIVDSGERNKETVGKTTRSRESKKIEYEVECNNGKTIVSTVGTFDDGKVEEEDVVDSGRVVRTRRKMEGQEFKNASKREKKDASDGDKRDEKASDGVNSEKPKEIVDNHNRVTRSRAQRLTEAPAEMGKRGRKVVRDIGKVAAVNAETVENGECGADSLSKRGGKCDRTSATGSNERMKTNGEGLKENLVNKQTGREDVTVAPQGLLRRSKRKANMVGECEMFIDDKKKYENGEIKGSLQKPKLLASDDSPLDAEVIQNEVNIGTRAVLKTEEPHKRVEPRRSNRRNTVMESDDLRADTGTRYLLRSSIPLSDIAPGVCKDDKNVLQPFGVMRRSRRKTCLKLDSGNVTDSAVENIKEEKQISKACIEEKYNSAVQKNTRSRRNTSKYKPPGIIDKTNGDSNTHQQNKVTKRKRCHVSAGDVMKTNDDLDVGAQLLTGSSTKKVMSAAATGKFVDEGKQPLSVDIPYVLDASRHGSSGNGKSQFLDVQLSVSNIIDVELTSFKKTDKKKEEVSLADSAGCSCMNLFDGEELANADTNAIELLETDSTFSKDQNCGTNSLLEGEVQEPTVKNITDVDNKIIDQVLAEDKTRSSSDILLVGDQTVVMTNLKVTETEADEHAQPFPRVVDHHNDLENSNEDASQRAGEDKTFVSCETNYTHSKNISKLKVPSSSIARLHVHNVAEGNEILFRKDIASELAEADEDGCSKEHGNASKHFSEFDMPDLRHGETHKGESSNGQKSKCEEHGVFCLANLFDAEGRYGITPQGREKFSDEHSVKDLDDQGILHGSAYGAPITICYSTGDHEANLSAEGGRTNCKDKQSESIEADESGCMKSHKSSKDEDWVSSIFNLFDEEKSAKIEPKPKDIGVVSDKYSTTDLEHEIFSNLPDVSTDCENYTEVNSGRYSSNFQEINLSTPSSVSETQAEQQKSLPAKYNTAVNTNQAQEAWSHASELEGNAVFFLKNYPEGKISQVAQGLSADEDVKHANYGLDTEDSAGACISDVKNRTVSKRAAESLSDVKFQDLVGTEQKHEKLLTTQTESDAGEDATHAKTQSWTEIELYNLFGTTADEDAPPGLGDTFCHGTEIANMTISNHKSTPSNSGSLNKRNGKEMEGESRSECAKTKNKDMVLPTALDADISGNGLKFLFATPVKITTPCLIEETYSYNRIFNKSVTSIQEFLDTLKKDVATEHTANGKGEHAEYEVENNLCIGASLSDNREDDIGKESNEIESFKLLNTSTTIHSGAEYDGNKGLEDHLAPDKEEEVLKATNLISEDKKEHAIPLAKSCIHDETRNENFISSSGSPCDLYELESCAGMPETLSYKMIQNDEVVVELSDADLQKSGVPQNMNLLTAASDDVSILRETSIETSGDPKVAKVGSFHKDVSDKGISPVLFSEASPDGEESTRESDGQSEAKIWDEKDRNPKLSQDTSDELHTNNEKATEESGPIGYNLGKELDQLQISDEPESTFEEAERMYVMTQILHDTDAAAEHESGLLSNSAMPSSQCYHEDGDKNLVAGELAHNGGKDTCEMINKVVSIELKDTYIAAIFETEYDVCEASDEELTEKTAECQKETNFITEDNEEKGISLGQSCLSDEGRDHASANTISLSASPNNLDKLEGCQDMSIDTAQSESLSCKSIVDHKSEQEIQNSEASSKLSNTFGGPLVVELANTGSLEGLNDTEKGTLHHSPKVSKDLNGAKISDEIDAKAKSSKGMSDEPHVNSEVKGLSALSDSDNLPGEADKLPCSIELESTSFEAKGTGRITHDPNIIVVPAAEHGSSLCGAVSSMLSSSEMILHLRGESNDVENLSGDDDKNSEKAEENSTAQLVELSMELHFEENAEVFKSDTLTISNLPTTGYSKLLKECDVADTIKEYIDSESSLSVILENSSTSVPVDMLAHTDERTAGENSALTKHGDDIARRLTDEDRMLSVNCFESETKEQEEAVLFMGPPQVSGNAVDSLRCVGFLAEGSPMKLDCQKKIDSVGGHELRSTTRKNARTILIHGTPGKLPNMKDMKENAPKHKSSNMGDITAVRPVKRRALQYVHWK